MSKTTPMNRIKPSEKGAEVILDPAYLLKHALYMPDSEKVSTSNMTLGQAIEAIALAHVKARLPEGKADQCRCAKIEFKDGKFIVNFADRADNLTF